MELLNIGSGQLLEFKLCFIVAALPGKVVSYIKQHDILARKMLMLKLKIELHISFKFREMKTK